MSEAAFHTPPALSPPRRPRPSLGAPGRGATGSSPGRSGAGAGRARCCGRRARFPRSLSSRCPFPRSLPLAAPAPRCFSRSARLCAQFFPPFSLFFFFLRVADVLCICPAERGGPPPAAPPHPALLSPLLQLPSANDNMQPWADGRVRAARPGGALRRPPGPRRRQWGRCCQSPGASARCTARGTSGRSPAAS